MPVVRTDGRSVGRSRDYQVFWDGQIYLPMVLRWCASRTELRYNFSSMVVGISDSLRSIPDSKVLYSRFHNEKYPVFQIPRPNVSLIPESGFPYIGRQERLCFNVNGHTNLYEPFKLFRISSTDLKSLKLHWSRLYYPDKWLNKNKESAAILMEVTIGAHPRFNNP